MEAIEQQVSEGTEGPALSRETFLAFWGKARPSEAAGPGWHPVACHCLDVAAVAEALLDANPSLASHLASLAGWAVSDWIRTVVLLVGLHDLGKFSRSFQSMAPAYWPPVLGDVSKASRERHDHIGCSLLKRDADIRRVLDSAFQNWPPESLPPLIDAVAGHHGRPAPDRPPNNRWPDSVVCPESRAAAAAFAAELVAVIAPPPLPPPPKKWSRQASWWLAGLTTLCDWIGSAQHWFPYAGDEVESLQAYWPLARRRAAEALRASGVLPVRPGRLGGVAGLAPSIGAAGFSPTPIQRCAEQVELPEGPLTLLIEDATGSGKTEAALVLAHRLIASGRADGLFIALPTMATADAMYLRLADSYRALFDAGDAPSQALAHGRAGLNTVFQGSILPQSDAKEDKGDQAGPTASIMCNGWIAEERRRTFFAHVGVGTIDQALLGVLPSKYATLRLFGLARRVLVVDEAHSYDTYVGIELTRLLAFHRMLGGSSIVLSATLPQRGLADLLGAAPDQRGDPAAVPYPLLSVAAGGVVRAYPASMRAELVRSLPVRRVASVTEAAGYLIAAARAGACGIWIRNTVTDAMAAAEVLRAAGMEPMLFHARFAMGDRLAVQARVLEQFGKHSTPESRAPGGIGRILVATQVVEQSLDLDADVMVSDLAPVDLLIQRAGRLRRHPSRARPAGAPEAALLVVSPEPVAEAEAGWAADPALGGTRFVYDPHILWLSARALFAAGRIDVPHNLRALVEAVYGAAAEPVPPGLQTAENRAKGRDIGTGALARANLLDPAQGYCRQNGEWEPDTMMPTRLGGDDRVFRLAREDGGTLVPFCADADPARAWALSEISLRRSQATDVPPPPSHLRGALDRLLKGWPEWQRQIPVLVLSNDDDDIQCWRGRVRHLNGDADVIYTATQGMTFRPNG